MTANPTSDGETASDSDELESIGRPSAAVGRRIRGLLLLGFVAMAGVGLYFAQVQPYMLQTMVLMLVFALFAIGFDFAFGFSGMHSFGHAAMFGIGGYVTAYLLTEVTTSAPVVLSLSILAGVLMALLIGVIGARTRGIYFAMITLAFAQIVHIFAMQDVPATVLGQDSITGGDNGMFGLQSMAVPGLDLAGSVLHFYLFVLVLVAASTLLLVRVANSRFGAVLRAIQQNEERVTHLGYDVGRYKLIGFAISGGVSALAGSLLVAFQGIAHPDPLLDWTVSGDIIFMTLLGGMGTLWGPMLGAAVYIYIEESFYWFPHWRFLLAGIFVVVIIFFPKGLAGLLRSAWDRLSRLGEQVRDRRE